MEETQQVVDNYKQLIRMQDEQLQTFDLLRKGGDSGIEVIEEMKKSQELVESLKKKQESLEQDVYDWKERFSEKEKRLREKEQECEQLNNSLQDLHDMAKKEEEEKEEIIQELESQIQATSEAFSQYREEKENEMNTYLISLTKKQEQIDLLNDATKDYEVTIAELKSDLQNSTFLSFNNHIHNHIYNHNLEITHRVQQQSF